MAIRKPIFTQQMAVQTSTTAASGTSGPIVLPAFDYNELVFKLTCSSMSATAILDVWVQSSLDGGNTWYDVLRFPRFNASSANPAWGAANLSSGAALPTIIGSGTIAATAGGPSAQGVPLLSNVIQTIWALGGTTPTASFEVDAIGIGFDRGGQ